MALAIHPIVAPPGLIRIWLGVFDHRDPPEVTWVVDGQPATPAARRPLRPVWDGSVSTRSGVFELSGAAAAAGDHVVQAFAGTGAGAESSNRLTTRGLPAQLTSGLDASFTVLLASCFAWEWDQGGAVSSLVQQYLTGPNRPDLTLLVGDQVYLDSPFLERHHERDRDRLAAGFEAKYRHNWQGAYAGVLRAAPVAAIPDDHEYWNNYPHRSWAPLTPKGKVNWTEAAAAMYAGFQLGTPRVPDPSTAGQFGPDQYCYAIDVPPLSFFMMDNRTYRRADGRTTLPPDGARAYRDWQDRVIEQRLVGILVTGPSLFQPPKDIWTGKEFDRNLANYGDYGLIMAGLRRLARAGRPVLALTGDVHYGRVTWVFDPEVDPGSSGRSASMHEIIASPSSLVGFEAAFAPKHPEAKPAPPIVRFREADNQPWSQLMCQPSWPVDPEHQKGDHVALLQFRRTMTGADLTVTYWMVRRDGGTPITHTLPLIQLRG